MRFTDQASYDGVIERLFTVDELPGALWLPENAVGPRPLILMGHGGGQHKKAPGMVARATRFAADGGFAVAVVDAPAHGDRPKDTELSRIAAQNRVRMEAGEPIATVLSELHDLVAAESVPEWRRVLDALQELDTVGAGPVGYWGVSMGCGLGVPFVAAEPRVRAAVLGLGPVHAGGTAAAAVTVPVEFLVQWDDERIPRAESLALFDALGSTEKTLHANTGGHADVPLFEIDSALRFFLRHLT